MFTKYIKEIKSGYVDANGDDKGELYLEYAKFLAEKFADEKNAYAQMRSMYQLIHKLVLQMKLRKISFNQLKNEFRILLSKANDKKEKGTLSQSVLDFLEHNFRSIKSEKDIEVFDNHLMCILNYYPREKTSSKDNNNKKFNNGNNNNYRKFNK